MLRRRSRGGPFRPAVLFAALTLTVTALASGAAGASRTGADGSIKDNACLSAPAEARVRAGAQGVDPNSVSGSSFDRFEKKVSARVAERGVSARRSVQAAITVRVRWHVITSEAGEGRVSRRQIAQQLAVLNQAYAGRSSGPAARTIFRFATKSIDYTANDEWYNWPNPDVNPTIDEDAKTELHRGGMTDLNVYIANLQDGLLGYATFPFDTTLARDGVVLLNESLPGGSAAPYNEGDTATHEIGHWLGLFHTFQNGCTPPGDGVADTPYQNNGINIFFCEESDDTCPQPGLDPVHNFMSYGDDPCLDRFTFGQSVRMALVWFAFRTNVDLLP